MELVINVPTVLASKMNEMVEITYRTKYLGKSIQILGKVLEIANNSNLIIETNDSIKKTIPMDSIVQVGEYDFSELPKH